MKNLYILSTDKPSKLSDCHDNKLHLDDVRYLKNYLNIYITSDEQIKDGEYGVCLNLIREGFKSHQAVFKMGSEQRQAMEDLGGQVKAEVLKVVLTTDQDLIKNGVQAIDDEFLEWFVKNPNCREIEVIPLRKSSGYYDEKEVWHWDFLSYKIIIPKEDTKQETLEEAAERIFDGFGDIAKPVVIKQAIELVKGQQERMYSEEEVLKIIDLLFHKYASSFRVDAKEDFLLSKKK